MSAFFIPPGLQTFLDPATGALLSLGSVEMYIPATLTGKATWVDEAQTTLNTNPINLNAGGQCAIWGSGLYRQIVKRRDGTVVWDIVTGFVSSGGGGGGGDVSGPGVSVPGHVAVFDATDGKSIADGGVLGALATKSAINNADWSGAVLSVPNGGTGRGTVPSNGQLLIGNGADYTLSTLTAGSGVSITNAAGAITIAFTGGGSGTVTSVAVDGGLTGLTTSGGPIVGAGTISLGGTLLVAHGGTGGTDAATARANLGAEPLGQFEAIDTKTGSYTLVLTDAGHCIEMNVAGANTLTIPPNSSVAFPVKTRVDLVQIGAGACTITPGAGVTIRSLSGLLKTGGQYAGASIYKRGTDEWVAIGNLVA